MQTLRVEPEAVKGHGEPGVACSQLHHHTDAPAPPKTTDGLVRPSSERATTTRSRWTPASITRCSTRDPLRCSRWRFEDPVPAAAASSKLRAEVASSRALHG